MKNANLILSRHSSNEMDKIGRVSITSNHRGKIEAENSSRRMSIPPRQILIITGIFHRLTFNLSRLHIF